MLGSQPVENQFIGELDGSGNQLASHFEEFLSEYEEIPPEGGRPVKLYRQEADVMRQTKRTTMRVNYKHLINQGSHDFVLNIYQEFYLYEPFLKRAVTNFIYSLYPDYAKGNNFYVSFYNVVPVEGIRDLRSNKLGKLVAIKGTVTKVSEVRPELVIGAFNCKECGTRARSVEQQFSYSMPKGCPNPHCMNKTMFELVSEASLFTDWQKVRVQELNSDLPTGSTPRSIEVVLRNELVDSAQPGDRAILVGMLIVVPDAASLLKPGEKIEVTKKTGDRQRTQGQGLIEGITGLAGLGVRDLNYKLVFLANHVSVNNNDKSGAVTQDYEVGEENLNDMLNKMTEMERNEILKLSREPDLFSKMADLIAPNIYGNKDLKKGVLLTLLGGVSKKSKEGMKIRGDMNLCVVGDPATAKSQVLQYVHRSFPRTVYTSGKGSTAAGLTAALSKDHESGEFTIEAGALILADNGLCCIDEFDKMDEKDMVAIHEAMEQQTISISKAGIQATLNARCSVLAAANPIFGRYDKSKTLKANINLSPPLMSRFDLFFVLTDDSDERTDTILARHMINSHRSLLDNKHEEPKDFYKESGLFTQASLQRFIRFAKKLTPKITPEAADLLKKGYLRLRSNELSLQKAAYRITVRQLESLIRLSEALAKVHVYPEVTTKHVEIAFELLAKSMISVHQPDIEEVEEAEEEKAEEAQEAAEEKPNAFQSQLSKKQKVTFKIPQEEYDRISQAVIHILREVGNSMPRSELQLRFLEGEVAKVQSVQRFNELDKLIQIILKRMSTVDKIVLLTSNSEKEEDPFVSLHPQFLSNLD